MFSRTEVCAPDRLTLFLLCSSTLTNIDSIIDTTSVALARSEGTAVQHALKTHFKC